MNLKRHLWTAASLLAVAGFLALGVPAHAASITLSDPSCGRFVLSGTPPNQTLVCDTTPGPIISDPPFPPPPPVVTPPVPPPVPPQVINPVPGPDGRYPRLHGEQLLLVISGRYSRNGSYWLPGIDNPNIVIQYVQAYFSGGYYYNPILNELIVMSDADLAVLMRKFATPGDWVTSTYRNRGVVDKLSMTWTGLLPFIR